MSDAHDVADVVPEGERRALQRTAQETGERLGATDATLEGHARHLDRINGSIGDLARSMAEQATSTAVMAAAVARIDATLATSDERGVAKASQSQGRSTQWWLAVFAAFITVTIFVMGTLVTIAVAIVVLIANGKL